MTQALLGIFSLSPSTSDSFTDIPPVSRSDIHFILRARLLTNGQVATAGYTKNYRTREVCHIMTLARVLSSGKMEHVILPGQHDMGIVTFGQLPEGRIVSASYDGTLKIRSVNLNNEDREPQVTTLENGPPREESFFGNLFHPILDMVVFDDGRCVTVSDTVDLTLWDLSQPSKEHKVATLSTSSLFIKQLHRLTQDSFVSESNDNLFQVWQLTDSGATCTGLLDPEWPDQLSAKQQKRTGEEPPYDVEKAPLRTGRLKQKLSIQEILPERRIVVGSPKGVMRICDLADRGGAPQRVCMLPANGQAERRSLPIIAVGPLLDPPVTTSCITTVLPDGRLVRIEQDGSVRFYSPNNPNNATDRTVDNLFSTLPEQYRAHPRTNAWMVSVGDGRLLAACQVPTKHPRPAKTLFLVYDPYAPVPQNSVEQPMEF